MNSYNHYALGAVSGCGRCSIRGAGARGGDYRSAIGLISTDWEQAPNGAFRLEVEIPANSTARIHLPARPGQTVRVGWRPLAGRTDMSVERGAAEVVVRTGSGRYHFGVA